MTFIKEGTPHLPVLDEHGYFQQRYEKRYRRWGDLPHSLGPLDASEGSEVLDVGAVSAPGARVVQVGEHSRSGGMSPSAWNSTRLKRRK